MILKAIPRMKWIPFQTLKKISSVTKKIDSSYFPYGSNSWEQIVTKKKFFVDNTEAIRNLESTGEYLKLWRPRRFGKTLLCDQLALYYDISICGDYENFKRLFGETYIGRNPTADRGKFLVLFFSFNEIDPQNVPKSFRDHINRQIKDFSDRYYHKKYLKSPVEIDNENPWSSFSSLVSQVGLNGHQLYVIVDEYDNFANQLMMNINFSKKNSALSQYSELVAGNDSLLKVFGNNLKSKTRGPLGRMFFTGITPMAFCDALSGLSMVTDISNKLIFADAIGFKKSDVETVLNEIIDSRKDIQIDKDYHMNKIQSHFNGYRFHPKQKEGVYNPQACLYYFQSLIETGEEPNPILDSNIYNSPDNFIQFLVRHNFTKLVLEKELNITWFELIFGSLNITSVVKTNIRSGDLFVDKSSPATLLSLAYHHGYLTYSNPDNNMGKLVCPNLEFQRLLLETLLICDDEKQLRPIINNILLAEEKRDKKQNDFYKQEITKIGAKWMTPEILQSILKFF